MLRAMHRLTALSLGFVCGRSVLTNCWRRRKTLGGSHDESAALYRHRWSGFSEIDEQSELEIEVEHYWP